MHRLIAFLLLGTLLTSNSGATGEERVQRSVVVVRLANHAITPMTVKHVRRSIRDATEKNAECVVVVLDTPGGLLESTRDLVKDILNSRVPVVVYIAPRGARAASAGVFITLASHVAAMAPGTNIGAAHPVQIGGLPGSAPNQKENGKPSVIEQKILNDTVAWARSLAEFRGRDADWAARAVRESISITASEAVGARQLPTPAATAVGLAGQVETPSAFATIFAIERGKSKGQVVEILAEDVKDLLAQLDSRQVTLPQGVKTLRTVGAEVHETEMWWGDRVLVFLANPNVAFLFFIFGFLGILLEMYTPGWGVAGTVGVICLVLSFFALAVLPVNLVGLLLMIVALGLFVAEVFVVSFGFLTVGGVI